MKIKLSPIQLRELIVEIIRKCKKGDSESGKPWCLYSISTGKLLGRHSSKESAKEQEKAIHAHSG